MKTIKIRTIKPVFSTTELVCEDEAIYRAGQRFTAASQVSDWFRALKDEAKESFITLHLDGKNRIACMEVVSIGSLNQSIVHPREVFKTALLSSAAAIILIHNHPTGDTTPSQEDITITRRLKEAGDILGIKVLDHIIIGDTGFYSFVESGIL
jgi:DNA repair protein RadC